MTADQISGPGSGGERPRDTGVRVGRPPDRRSRREVGTMNQPVVITVTGRPAPQGSKRHVGGGRLIEQSTRVKPWREAVKEAVRVYRHSHGLADYRFPQGQPVSVGIVFAFDKPRSAPKTRRTWPVTRSTGDVDKLLRSTFDALTDSGLIWDDSQIVHVTARKAYLGDTQLDIDLPGARITLWGIT